MHSTSKNCKPAQSSNIFKHRTTVTYERRSELNGHKSVLVWFTGLSGSGKSTIAHAVEENLFSRRCQVAVLDGDNVRHGLCGDLGFSIEDRSENIRRIGEVTKLFIDLGMIILTAFISPLEKDRQFVKGLVGAENYLMIHCDCPIEICEERDVKGNYKRAREGIIKNYTGISSPYEVPQADLVLNTNEISIEESVKKVVKLLQMKGIISK